MIALFLVIILSVIDFNQLFLLIGGIATYALFKAMDIYYEVSNSN